MFVQIFIYSEYGKAIKGGKKKKKYLVSLTIQNINCTINENITFKTRLIQNNNNNDIYIYLFIIQLVNLYRKTTTIWRRKKRLIVSVFLRFPKLIFFR